MMKTKTAVKENRAAEAAVLAVCLLLLLPLLLLGRYDRPSADDYDYALLTHQAVTEGRGIGGILRAAWETDLEFYNSWQGLYTSAFLLALQPGIFGETLYGLTPLLLLSLFFLCLFFGFRILNRLFLGFSALFPVSAAAFSLCFLMLWLPCPVEGLYWYNGAVNYMPWVFVTFLNLCLLTDISCGKPGPGRYVRLFLSVLLAFLTSGGNHVTAFANILLLLFAAGLCLLKKRRPYPLLPLTAACIGFFLVLSAPGTALRQSQLQKAGVLDTVLHTLSYCKSLLPWLSLPWFLSLLLITPLLVRYFRSRREENVRFPLLPLLYSAMVLCGMLCVPFYAMSFFGDGRLTNVVWAVFVLLSWADYALLLRFALCRLQKKTAFSLPQLPAAALPAAAAVLLVLAAFLPSAGTQSSSRLALSALSDGSAREYAAQMDDRFAQLKESGAKVVVPAIRTKPPLLFFAELAETPEEWPNSVIGQYYGKEIRLQQEQQE